MDGAEGILVVGPAYSTEVIARDAAAHLRPGTTVAICPGSCVGSVAFKRAAGLDLELLAYRPGQTTAVDRVRRRRPT